MGIGGAVLAGGKVGGKVRRQNNRAVLIDGKLMGGSVDDVKTYDTKRRKRA